MLSELVLLRVPAYTSRQVKFLVQYFLLDRLFHVCACVSSNTFAQNFFANTRGMRNQRVANSPDDQCLHRFLQF